MPGLHEYSCFIADLEQELSRLQSLVPGTGLPVSPCRPGCSACCLPLTLLPLEAYFIMSECDQEALAAGNGGRDCAFLTSDRTCAIYRSRPFLCRTRGFPILRMNEDGEWERDSCARRGFPSPSTGTLGLHLERWNARLFHLNAAFCAERGIAPRRVPIAELAAMPQTAPEPAALSRPPRIRYTPDFSPTWW